MKKKLTNRLKNLLTRSTLTFGVPGICSLVRHPIRKLDMIKVSRFTSPLVNYLSIILVPLTATLNLPTHSVPLAA
jgi:hypothetical protein